MMQEKNKNKIHMFLKVLIGAVLLFVIVLGVMVLMDKDEVDEGDTYDQNIKIINETHPVKLLVYGENIYFRPALKYEYIDQITSDVLELDSEKYDRVVLVVNDFDGTVELSEEDYLNISSFLEKGDLDFYYLGTAKFDEFIEYEIWQGDIGEDDMSLGSALFYNNMSYFTGIWTKYDENMSKDNEENLGMILVSQIVRCIKSNN